MKRGLTHQSKRYVGNAVNVILKKFYKRVEVLPPKDPLSSAYKFSIFLDGKVSKTPSQRQLQFRKPELAYLVAAEFDSQDQYLIPSTMPLLTMSRTAVDADFDTELREKFIMDIVNFVQSDTACYREEEKRELSEIQDRYLNPLIARVNQKLNTNLGAARGLMDTIATDDDSQKIRDYVRKIDPWHLTSLNFATNTLKSFILGYNLLICDLPTKEAVFASRLEESYQIDQYGLVHTLPN
eukprot:TRINITY_DN2618_c0_g1_i5.p1 TRINITY_DN2618_c0_g1~~TRINITY_DN2618_c0_g1_i5.p1  ORF type:complete len:239 (+),score=33.72 TRINITY_DN2618_c0_g1_i5:185-901(+)